MNSIKIKETLFKLFKYLYMNSIKTKEMLFTNIPPPTFFLFFLGAISF